MFNKKLYSLMKISAVLAIIMNFYSGCSGFKALNFSATDNSSTNGGTSGGIGGGTVSPGTTGIDSFKVTVYPLLKNYCVSCHATQQPPLHASPDLTTAYNAAFTKLSLTKPAESVLVLKSGDGHCKINNCVDHIAEIKAQVLIWAAHETSTTPLQVTSNARLRLANRRFVGSKLNDLFGSPASTPVNNMIANQFGVFGGPCDHYRNDFSTYGNTYGMPQGDCDNISNSQASVMAPNTAPRLAIMNRACNRILQDDVAVNNIVTKAFGSTTPVTNGRPSDSDLQKLYGVFFTGRLADSTVIGGLRGLSDKAQALGYPNIESWRFTLVALCQSPDWQIP